MKAEASDKNSLTLKLFGVKYLVGGATAEVSATAFRGRPLRLGGSGGAGGSWRGGRPLCLGGSGGTGGGWRQGLPQRGGSTGASSSAVKAGLRHWTETTSTLLPTWSWKVLGERDKTL